MSDLRAGVIGFGYTGRLHLTAYEQCGVRVVGVAETRPEVLETAPAHVRRFASFAGLLEADIDAVSICLPTGLHCRAVLNALAAGKHVLLEKPVAATVADADAMIAAAQRAGRCLFVGMTHRFYPEVLQAKRIVEDGGIGEIVAIRDCILEHFGFLNSPQWYLQKETAGGGTALSSGIHMIDRVMWFMGESPTSVFGSASNRFFGRDVEDAAQIALGFPSGRSAQITCAFLREPHPLVCDLEVIGTAGSIVVHTWQGYEYRSSGGTEQREIYTSEPHIDKVLVGLRGEVEEFCGAIQGGREPRPSAVESTRALRVIEAFYRAAKTGAVERLEL